MWIWTLFQRCERILNLSRAIHPLCLEVHSDISWMSMFATTSSECANISGFKKPLPQVNIKRFEVELYKRWLCECGCKMLLNFCSLGLISKDCCQILAAAIRLKNITTLFPVAGQKLKLNLFCFYVLLFRHWGEILCFLLLFQNAKLMLVKFSAQMYWNWLLFKQTNKKFRDFFF